MRRFSGFRMADLVVLRTPLLPFAAFSGLVGAGATESSAPEEIRRRLLATFECPVVQEAIRIGSKSLHERMLAWAKNPFDAAHLKTERALIKYLSRMTSRCTPFGLFSGVSWIDRENCVKPADGWGFQLAGRDRLVRKSRVDIGVVVELNEQLAAEEGVRRQLRFFVNPTLYRCGAGWRYVEANLSARGRHFSTSVIESTPYLEGLLEAMWGAPSEVPFAELVRILRQLEPTASEVEASKYVDELIAAGVLLSDMEPSMTGGDPFDAVAAVLKSPIATGRTRDVTSVERAMKQLNSCIVGAGVTALEEAEAALTSLLERKTPKHLIQTDLHKPLLAAAVPPALVDEISPGLDALAILSRVYLRELSDFREAFVERFGSGVVPLTDALDPDNGVPFGRNVADAMPLIAGMTFAGRPQGNPMNNEEVVVTNALTRLFETACRNQNRIVDLSDGVLEQIEGQRDVQLPKTMYAMVTVIDGTAEERSPAFVIRSAGNGSGLHLMGRFTSGDGALSEQARRLARLEDDSTDTDGIHAEIIHWPTNRLGNVILRSQLRSRELPLFGRAAVPKDHQILPKDILISVRDAEVVLQCRKTRRRIYPRLSSAHNAEYNSVPLYQFLVTVQKQDLSLLSFQWPATLRYAARLPRVTYRKAILSPEMWNLDEEKLKSIRKVDSRKAHDVVVDWAASLEWPRFVELMESDNCLCIDMKNPLAIDTLVRELRDKNAATLREAFPPGSSGFARAADGAYCNELVVAYHADSAHDAASARRVGAEKAVEPVHTWIARQRFPGDEWLYLKLYCGTAVADRILRDYAGPVVRELISAGVARKWFFLRYREPDPHLRIRIQGTRESLWSTGVSAINLMLNGLRNENLISRAVFDTYDPEIERYGGAQAMHISEEMFFVDSECAQQLIADGLLFDPDMRWRWILFGVHQFWKCSPFGIEELEGIYRRLAHSQRARYVNGGSLKFSIDARFRSVRTQLESLLREPGGDSGAPGIFQRRSWRLRPLATALQKLGVDGALSSPLEHIFASHVHMSINRLCTSVGSAQEYVIYEFLSRLLTGLRAKERKQEQLLQSVG